MSKNERKKDSLSESVSSEILAPSLDLSIDYTELGLDEFLVDGILKEVPIVKTIYAVGKIGYGIRERYFVKKLLVFLKEFHLNSVDEKELEEFKSNFNNDDKYRNKVTEHLIVHIESFLNIEKGKILARLLHAHIQKKFDWDHFIHLSACLDSMNPKAFQYLGRLADQNFLVDEDPEKRKVVREFENEPLLYSCGVAFQISSWSSGFKVSQLGIDLFNYGIKC